MKGKGRGGCQIRAPRVAVSGTTGLGTGCGEDACVGPGRRGLSCRSLPTVMPVVVTTSNRRRRERRVFNSSSYSRFESSSSLSLLLILCHSRSTIHFARACEHVVALARSFESLAYSRRGCRRRRGFSRINVRGARGERDSQSSAESLRSCLSLSRADSDTQVREWHPSRCRRRCD